MDRTKASAQRRIVEALDGVIRCRPRGTISAVCRAAGRKPNWWQARVEAGTIGLGELLAVLDHLGLDPATFFQRVLGEEGDLGMDRPAGEPPAIVIRVQERIAKGREGTGLGADFLETLDRERYEEAEGAARQALWAAERIELVLLPRLLGVAGSIYRKQFLLREAYHTLHAGLALARECQDPLVQAELTRRLAYVVADDAQYPLALELAEQAAWLYLRHGDRAGMGTALVPQGMWLYYLDRAPEAIEAQRMALDLLPEGRFRHRCAAYQGLALYHQRLGNREEALRNAALAQRLAPNVGGWERAMLSWLMAELLGGAGHLAEAESAQGEVFRYFRSRHFGEAALAACDLVRIQLLQNRAAEAYETAASMLPLLEPLRNNSHVSGAIAELLRGGRRGLTLTLVERVRASMEAEQRNRDVWRSLRHRRKSA